MAIVTVNPRQVRPLIGASSVSMKTAGEATQIGRVVYIGNDDLIYETDGAAAAKVSGTLGLIVGMKTGMTRTTGVISEGERCTVLWWGRVVLGEDAELDPTNDYYAADETSTVTGLIGDVAGTVTRRLGSPEDSQIFFWNPDTSGPTS